MTATVNTSGTTSLTSIMDDIDLGPTNSIQFAFAKLQLAQAQASKVQAETYMKQIQEIQDDQKKVAEMISEARKQQNAAKTSGKETAMSDEMIAYFDAKGLSYDKTNNDKNHNYDQWSYNIQSLTNYQESISNKTQTLMVYLQDFISQYNSYLQGANSAISNASQVLSSIAMGR